MRAVETEPAATAAEDTEAAAVREAPASLPPLELAEADSIQMETEIAEDSAEADAATDAEGGRVFRVIPDEAPVETAAGDMDAAQAEALESHPESGEAAEVAVAASSESTATPPLELGPELSVAPEDGRGEDGP